MKRGLVFSSKSSKTSPRSKSKQSLISFIGTSKIGKNVEKIGLLNMEGEVVARRFKLGKKLGSGSFGVIYHAKEIRSNSDVAVKLEKTNTRHP
jgi:hypothetical protein